MRLKFCEMKNRKRLLLRLEMCMNTEKNVNGNGRRKKKKIIKTLNIFYDETE